VELYDIHVQWEGPYSLGSGSHGIKSIQHLNDPDKDFGLYQIYTHHPLYGRSLVYIGQAFGQTFAGRIPQHNWASGSETDPDNIEVYVGRLKGNKNITLEQWRIDVDAAEKLLIHSHAPAYNSSSVKSPPGIERCGSVRVLNWGAVRSLNREVSGTMWTALGQQFNEFSIYQKNRISQLNKDVV
jgi:hypothetical protein